MIALNFMNKTAFFGVKFDWFRAKVKKINNLNWWHISVTSSSAYPS